MANVGDVLFRFLGDTTGVERAATKTQSVLSGVAKAAAGVFAGISLVRFAKEVADTGEQLLSVSRKTQISVENLSVLKNVAETNEASFETLSTGLLQLQRNLANVADEEGQRAASALAKIGLNAEQLKGLKTDQVFELIAQRLGDVDDAAAKTQIQMALFRGSGTELNATLEQVAEKGMAKLRMEAEAAGRVIRADAARSLDEMGDSLTETKNTLIAAAAAWGPYIKVAVEGLAMIARGLTEIINLLPKAKVGEWAADIGKLLGLIPLSRVEELGKISGQAGLMMAQLASRTGIARAELEKMTGPEIRKRFLDLQNIPVATPLGNRKDIQAIAFDLAEAKDRMDELTKAGQEVAKTGETAKKAWTPLADPKKLEEARQIIEGLRKSAQDHIGDLQLQVIELKRGEEAALEASQAMAILAAKNEIAAKKLPIPSEFVPVVKQADALLRSLGVDVDALNEKDLGKLTAHVMRFTEELKRAQAEAVSLASQLDLQKIRTDTGKAATDLTRQLELELMSQSGRILEEIRREREERLKVIEDWRAAAVEAEQARAAATGEARDQVIAAIEAEAAKRREMVDAVASKKLNEPFVRLEEELRQIDAQAKVFGGSFDSIRAKIDSVRTAIQDLIAQGFDRFPEGQQKIEDLAAELRELEEAARIEDVFRDAASGIKSIWDDFRRGEIRSWEDFGKKIFDVIDRIVSKWLDAQIEMAINSALAEGTGIGGFFSALFGVGQKTDVLGPKGGSPTPEMEKTFEVWEQLDREMGAQVAGLTGGATRAGALSGMFAPMPKTECCGAELAEILSDSVRGLGALITGPGDIFAPRGGTPDEVLMKTLDTFDALDQEFGAMLSQSTVGLEALQGTVKEFDLGLQDASKSTSSFSSWLLSLANTSFGGGGGGAGGIGGLFGMVGGLFGGGPVDAFTDVAGAGTSAMDFLDMEFGALLGVGHMGGKAGELPVKRLIDPAVFEHAERYHAGSAGVGLMANEVPAILEKGEQIIPVSSGATGIQPNNSGVRDFKIEHLHIHANDAQSIRRNRSQITGDLYKAGRTMASRLGMN
ncbi:MAG TPA: hypothetical protein VNL14_16665 [Candidatus Acidoferrales bacterium]|nr:hypothetical protein [Candidatus Acidoferrales bacterium]